MTKVAADSKKCTACGAIKLRTEFGVAIQGRSGPILRGRCRPCESQKTIEWKNRNPDKVRDTHLRRTYGITLADYRELLAQQGGVCAICQKPPGETRPGQGRVQGRPVRPLLAVDHDHNTGKVRGLLCIPCNRGIGFLGDDPQIISRAAEYLRGG